MRGIRHGSTVVWPSLQPFESFGCDRLDLLLDNPRAMRTITRSKMRQLHASEPGKPTKGSWELGTLDSGVRSNPWTDQLQQRFARSLEFPPWWILQGHWQRVSRIYLQHRRGQNMRQLPNEPLRWGSYFETPEPKKIVCPPRLTRILSLAYHTAWAREHCLVVPRNSRLPCRRRLEESLIWTITESERLFVAKRCPDSGIASCSPLLPGRPKCASLTELE